MDVLLEAGADPNTPGLGGVFPLVVAASYGNASTTKKLLDNNKRPDKKADSNLDFRGQDPPLYHAIVSGSLETVKLLLNGGARVHVTFRNGWTPMMMAAQGGRPRDRQGVVSGRRGFE